MRSPESTRPSRPPGGGRRSLVLVAALALMALTARLGVWQLDRAAQKEHLQAAIEAQAAASEWPGSALPTTETEAGALHYRRTVLHGVWLPEHTVYLDNRQMQGRPGFFVVTPLRLADGGAVLVQRGWLPRHAADRTRIAPYRTPAGEVTVVGRMAPWPSRLTSLGADAPGAIRQNLDPAEYAAQTGLRLRPLSITELPQPANADDGLLRDWPRPAVDVAKHYGYAAQWFGLCALTAGLYVWFQLLRPRRRHAGPGRD